LKVEINNQQTTLECPADEIRQVLKQALRMEGRDADLSIALVGDVQIAELNERFLGRREVTDVLAFPYAEEGHTVSGEVVVNAELAARQAAQRPHSACDELLLYVVHGLLHLLGYDDHEEEDTRRMRQREAQVLAAVGRRVEY